MKERTHILKCWPEPFQAMVDGLKTFEFRRDDRGFAVGDTLILKEWEPCGPIRLRSFDGAYTERELHVRVTYRLGSEFGVPAGFCVLSVEPITKA